MIVAVTLKQRSKNACLFLTELFESFYGIKVSLFLSSATIRYTLGGVVLCSVSFLFKNFSEKRGFEKVKNGRSSGGFLVINQEGYRFIPLPP